MASTSRPNANAPPAATDPAPPVRADALNPSSVDNPAIDAAIARVLTAEAAARERIAACAAEAERRVQQAREQARAIQARGAARAARVLAQVEGALDARLRALEAERGAVEQAARAAGCDRQRISRVVGVLADELLRGRT